MQTPSRRQNCYPHVGKHDYRHPCHKLVTSYSHEQPVVICDDDDADDGDDSDDDDGGAGAIRRY